MISWPLKSPPQIAADSLTIAISTAWTPAVIPDRADGSGAKFIMVTWDADVWLHLASQAAIGVEGTRDFALNPRKQPYVFDVGGQPEGLYFFRYPHPGSPTTNVHLTPLENT